MSLKFPLRTNLTDRELATVLAALRLWQWQTRDGRPVPSSYVGYFDVATPLTENEMDDPDTQEFYAQVQKDSVRKKCAGCGRMVKILPHYAYCDSCATKIEHGWDL